MPRTVTLTHDYPHPPAAVWQVATDLDDLAEVCRPLLRFSGLPSGRIRQGQVIEVGVRLFGILPEQPYRMTVVELDDDAMTFRSDENGSGVEYWRHTLSVTADGPGARLTETIEIEAGRATPAFAAWARLLYRRRHPGRLRILDRRASRM